MGQLLSDLQEQAELKAKEKLAALEKMANAQLESVKDQILTGSEQNMELYKGTVVSKMQKVVCSASSKATGVEDCISDFFDGEVSDGLKKLVNVALDTILGNTSIGESSVEDMLILFENGAIVRFDLYYWKWNFSDKGVIDVAENVMLVYCIKRVIDLETVNWSALVYAIYRMRKKSADHTDDDDNTVYQYIESVIDNLKKIKEKIGKDGFGGGAITWEMDEHHID